ncbi:hypothetical protein LTR17_010379 [Elasticomyces elasticus]|nr:hypothetical protein LTR17_010379 [Elasticomyces elasticus]
MASNDSAVPPIMKVCGICGSNAQTNGGTLFKCGRCKSVLYCSKECQVKDWPLHKAVCKTLAGPRISSSMMYAARAIPAGVEKYKAAFPAIFMTVSENANSPSGLGHKYSGAVVQNMPDVKHLKFMELPITTALGFSLSMVEYAHGSLPHPNPMAAILRTDIDPESPTFARPSLHVPVGAVLLARRDGKHMQAYQLAALVDYLRDEMREFFDLRRREARGEAVDRQDLIDRFLTPAAFASGFAKIKSEALALGQSEWEGVECPVEVDQEPKKVEDTTVKG